MNWAKFELWFYQRLLVIERWRTQKLKNKHIKDICDRLEKLVE